MTDPITGPTVERRSRIRRGRLSHVWVAGLAGAALLSAGGCGADPAPSATNSPPSGSSSAKPSSATSSPTVRPVAPGTVRKAGNPAVIDTAGATLKASITAEKGKRELLLDHPEFDDSRMVPTYVTFRVTNVGSATTRRPVAQIMQGFVPEEENGAEMMLVEPLEKFDPCAAKPTPGELDAGETYQTCRVAVSKRYKHPLAKVIYRGTIDDDYYNDPVVWKVDAA